MTALVRSTPPAGSAASGAIDFSPDMLVVRDIDLSDPDGRVSRFSDETWNLDPAGSGSTAYSGVYFGSTPVQFQDSLKRLVWCAANVDTPIDGLSARPNVPPRLAIRSIVAFVHQSWRPFLKWLDEQHIGSVSDVDADDLVAWREHVAQQPTSALSKDMSMGGLWRMWRYAPCLPPDDRLMQPPWEGADPDDFDDWDSRQPHRSENRTHPIGPDTMGALLVSCMHFVDTFSGDILAAKQRWADMSAAVRRQQRDGDVDRWAEYLAGLRRSGQPLPGCTLAGGVTGVAERYLAATLDVSLNTMGRNRPDDIAIRVGAPLDVEIRGRIDGQKWAAAIDAYELDVWVRRLATACVVVVSYLSGMRPGEVLALRRGCCRRSDATDLLSGYEIDRDAYELRGKTFKVRDSSGSTVRGGVERRHPWYVISPVARAIDVMERLHQNDLLFCVAAFGTSPRRSTTRTPNTQSVNDNIRALIEWCNTSGVAGLPAIPPDPNGSITLRRFRRTLAWHIYRLPGGLVALGVQYGHVNLLQSERYGRRAYAGMSDVLEEHAHAFRDRLEAGYEELAAGGAVSGPAADRFVAAVTDYGAQFRGSVLTRRDAPKLLKNPNLQIYDNADQFLACCYDASRALCHPDVDQTTGIDRSPDLLRCDPACSNIARTDAHMSSLAAEVADLDDEISSPATPFPIQVRLSQRRDRLLKLKADHERRRLTVAPEILETPEDSS